jgi:hypothetical protein
LGPRYRAIFRALGRRKAWLFQPWQNPQCSTLVHTETRDYVEFNAVGPTSSCRDRPGLMSAIGT